MAAKAVRIENNTIKKREFTLVKIFNLTFFAQIGFIYFFCNYENLYFYSIVYLQQPCYYF